MNLTMNSVAGGVRLALVGLALATAGLAAQAAGEAAPAAPMAASGAGMPPHMAGRGHGMHGAGQPPSAAEVAEQQSRMLARMSKRLNLTDDQQAKLKVMVAKMHELHHPPELAGKDPRAEMGAVVAGPKFDLPRAQALMQARDDAMRKHQPEMLTAAASFYDSLKPEQQTQVRDFMTRGGPMMMGPDGGGDRRRHHGHGGGMPGGMHPGMPEGAPGRAPG